MAPGTPSGQARGLTAVWISRKERVAIELDRVADVQAADLVGAAEWIAAA